MNLKIKITLIFLISNLFTVFAQQELYKEIDKRAIMIDSLRKVDKSAKENQKKLNENLIIKTDSIKILKSKLTKLEKFKKEKEKIDLLIKQKSDSISKLKIQQFELNQKLSIENNIYNKNLIDVKEKTKNEFLSKIVNTYKNKNFDDLIKLSTNLSIDRDIQLIGDRDDLKIIFKDLIIFFKAKLSLESPLDTEKIKDLQLELNNVKQSSALLNKLKISLENYPTIDKEFKECVNKISIIDKKETVSDMGDEYKMKKLNKILTVISEFIYNSDFNNTEYPYLSNILDKIIKIKFSNPDQDISKLIIQK